MVTNRAKGKKKTKNPIFIEIAKTQTLLATGLLLEMNDGTFVGPPRFVVVDKFGFDVREQWRVIDSISPSRNEDTLSALGVFAGLS